MPQQLSILCSSANGDLAPIIQADAFGRRLLIRGTHEQLTQVKAVLAQLGEDGTEKASEGGPVISIPLGGRNAADMLRILQRNWESQQPNPIRIVVPGVRNPVKGEYVPSKSGENEPPMQEETLRQPKIQEGLVHGSNVPRFRDVGSSSGGVEC